MAPSDLFSDTFLAAARQEMASMLDAGAGLKAAVLATLDGFDIASALRDGADPARIAALASSISTIGSVATEEAGLGACGSVILDTGAGFAVVRQLAREGHALVLIAVSERDAVLARALYRTNEGVKTLMAA